MIREGHIEQVGAPRELYEHPGSAFVASFFGRCALLPGLLYEGRVETALGSFTGRDAGAADGSNLCVVVRPEDVYVGHEGPYSGRVERLTCLGGTFEAEIAGPGWRVWAIVHDALKVGSDAQFSIVKSVTVPA